jgi:NAD(P)-dependent dehydrogenase (short-subunit alcohol dehydrogenase family)
VGSWDKVVGINLTGVFATLCAAAAVMKPQRRDRIVVTASIAGGGCIPPLKPRKLLRATARSGASAKSKIKGLALVLASPASSYMTWTVIPIDGGALAW